MPPASDTDLDYLDDMLTSLQAPPSPEASSLDVLLGDIHLDIPEMPAPSARPAPSAPAPARENVSPSFEVPGLGADLFDAPSEAPHDAPRDPFDFSTGELDFSLPDPGIGDALSGALTDEMQDEYLIGFLFLLRLQDLYVRMGFELFVQPTAFASGFQRVQKRVRSQYTI